MGDLPSQGNRHGGADPPQKLDGEKITDSMPCLLRAPHQMGYGQQNVPCFLFGKFWQDGSVVQSLGQDNPGLTLERTKCGSPPWGSSSLAL